MTVNLTTRLALYPPARILAKFQSCLISTRRASEWITEETPGHAIPGRLSRLRCPFLFRAVVGVRVIIIRTIFLLEIIHLVCVQLRHDLLLHVWQDLHHELERRLDKSFYEAGLDLRN